MSALKWQQLLQAEGTSPERKSPSYSAPSLQTNLPMPCIIPFINTPSYLQPLSECAHPTSFDGNHWRVRWVCKFFAISWHQQPRWSIKCVLVIISPTFSSKFLFFDSITNLSRCRRLWAHQYHLHMIRKPAQIRMVRSLLSCLMAWVLCVISKKARGVKLQQNYLALVDF